MAWAPEYCTSAELKSYLGVTTTVDDARIDLAIVAASRAVDRFTNRQFGLVPAPEARFYAAHWDRMACRWVVGIDDLMTVTGLAVSGDFALHPRNAVVEGKPWTKLVLDSAPADTSEVEVTARWGWTDVPAPIKLATLIQAARLFKRKDSPYGIAGSPEQGSELRLLAKIDPDVAVSLGSYFRQWGAV